MRIYNQYSALVVAHSGDVASFVTAFMSDPGSAILPLEGVGLQLQTMVENRTGEFDVRPLDLNEPPQVIDSSYELLYRVRPSSAMEYHSFSGTGEQIRIYSGNLAILNSLTLDDAPTFRRRFGVAPSRVNNTDLTLSRKSRGRDQVLNGLIPLMQVKI